MEGVDGQQGHVRMTMSPLLSVPNYPQEDLLKDLHDTVRYLSVVSSIMPTLADTLTLIARPCRGCWNTLRTLEYYLTLRLNHAGQVLVVLVGVYALICRGVLYASR